MPTALPGFTLTVVREQWSDLFAAVGRRRSGRHVRPADSLTNSPPPTAPRGRRRTRRGSSVDSRTLVLHRAAAQLEGRTLDESASGPFTPTPTRFGEFLRLN